MMSTTAIIICAGKCSRWKNYLGVRKHFIEIEGEILFHRTARLLKKYCKDDLKIYVVGLNDDYKLEGTELFIPERLPERGEADKFLNSKHLWNKDGRTLCLFGDIWFSEEAIQKICDYDERERRCFVRPRRSKITGCPHREHFGLSFYTEHIDEHERQFNRIVRDFQKGKIKECGGWELYGVMVGIPTIFLKRYILKRLMMFNILNHKIRVIDDFTDDFDIPDDYDKWIENWRKNKAL